MLISTTFAVVAGALVVGIIFRPNPTTCVTDEAVALHARLKVRRLYGQAWIFDQCESQIAQLITK